MFCVPPDTPASAGLGGCHRPRVPSAADADRTVLRNLLDVLSRFHRSVPLLSAPVFVLARLRTTAIAQSWSSSPPAQLGRPTYDSLIRKCLYSDAINDRQR
ncbi:hypothetical protein EVAR_8405_1 [Eumeta japonica]|uniref:Uncharacterized protein n=1 Tax=Eumeta variegata TaxID=151549 RepID=A0A4C1WF90_EUMVA|nr:hypothetical protein EVAR_8405_1 [Eumeta japonica]